MAAAPQISTITTAIAEMQSRGEGWCATLCVDGDPDRWVQVTPTFVNMAFPFEGEPLAHLAAVGIRIPDGLRLDAHEAEVFATFEYEEALTAALPAFIDEYFVGVFSCHPVSYSIQAELEDLG